MKFNEVSNYFELLEKVSSRIEMTKILADLFQKTSADEINSVCNMCLGLLRPPYQGTQFNFAQKSVIAVITQLLSVSEKEIKEAVHEYGDVGSVIAALYIHKPKHQLTIQEVYDHLCLLEKLSGKGSQEEKAHSMLELLQVLDPISAKFVIRILLGTLRLGFSDMTIIDALSWMQAGDKSLRTIIEHAYNICADLGLIASVLKKEGIDALKHMSIQLGIPIRPAAAERLPTAQDIIEKIGPCVAQPKLDGFRLQIHLNKHNSKNPTIHFFSRNLIDMSHMFPDLVKAFSTLPVHDIICEGEAISYDPNTGIFLPFQETVKRKRKHGIEQAITEYPLQVYLFDLLYLNGQSYLNKTHEERRKALVAVTQHLKDKTVYVIDEKYVQSAQELEEYFLQNIDRGLEGLVVKKPDSTYQPGKRNFNWIKLKRHAQGELEDTLDCVILGYYAGAGKRAQFGIGGFLVGIYNKKHDAYQTIAKIGTGLSDEDWKDLKKRCDKIAVTEKPKNIECAKELIPHVWVQPTIVCTIFADEITLSPLHTAGKTTQHNGFALRFPRFLNYRPDKSALETTTLEEVKRLYEDQFHVQAKQ